MVFLNTICHVAFEFCPSQEDNSRHQEKTIFLSEISHPLCPFLSQGVPVQPQVSQSLVSQLRFSCNCCGVAKNQSSNPNICHLLREKEFSLLPKGACYSQNGGPVRTESLSSEESWGAVPFSLGTTLGQCGTYSKSGLWSLEVQPGM